MNVGTVCSGIGAPEVAWKALGWRFAFASEIDGFPRAVFAHHHPEVPLHGDFTTIRAGEYQPIDLLAGGTPCQSFSVAGLRGGLDDHRGNLALEFLRLADRLRPRWLVWENVPGVLSSGRGRDFGAFLGALVELGYGFAYRVLDAQFFGVPQRRRRVFVVGHLGDWRRPAAVLLERESLRGHPAPHREPGPGPAQPVAACLRAAGNRTGGDRPPGWDADTASTYLIPVAFALRGRVGGAQVEMSGERVSALRAASGGSSRDYVATYDAVRRLTPRECERLQGFPDDYTLIVVPKRNRHGNITRMPLAADGPRYKALGNSMAVPVMRWIGERIAAVDALQLQEVA